MFSRKHHFSFALSELKQPSCVPKDLIHLSSEVFHTFPLEMCLFLMGRENSPNKTQREAHNIHLGEFEACKNGRSLHFLPLSRP